MNHPAQFNSQQLEVVKESAALAEELVSNFYKMSASQWLRPRYDIKTLAALDPKEIVHGPFAQIIRYEGRPKNSMLGSKTYDFYKICLQDHTILPAVKNLKAILLAPFLLYIVTHELIHIVRFSKFLQNFAASSDEIMAEESRVHQYTHKILNRVRMEGLTDVLLYYDNWIQPFDNIKLPR